jgi:hypothetical protein
MQVIKTKFDQNQYLGANEPGVCNALVLDWLANNGQPLRMGRRGVLGRARKTHDEGLKNATICEYGLKIHQRSNIYRGSNLPQLHAIKNALTASPVQKFLVGFVGDGNQAGHAIGMIKDAAAHKGFDPNNGYYRITGDDKMEWIFNKIFGAHVKHNYREFIVYELQ